MFGERTPDPTGERTHDPTSLGKATNRRSGSHGRRKRDNQLPPEMNDGLSLSLTASKYLDSPSQTLPVPSGECAEGQVGDIVLPGQSRPTVSLVVPAMNESENIPWVFGRIPDSVDEVILIDGYSTDDTIGVALRIRPDTRVVRQLGRGKGCALRAGFTAAKGDYIVMIDADGSMDPAEVGLFVQALEDGYDFVKGSRYLPGGGSDDLTRLRNFGNYALKTSVNMLFLVPFTDLCYGYVAFRRTCLEPLGLTSHGFEIETEMAIHAVKANLKIAEVPSKESLRRSGLSNLSTFRDGKRVLRTLVRERMSRRMRPVVDWLQFPEHPVSTVSSLNYGRTDGVDGTSIDRAGEKHTTVTVLAEQESITPVGGMSASGAPAADLLVRRPFVSSRVKVVG